MADLKANFDVRAKYHFINSICQITVYSWKDKTPLPIRACVSLEIWKRKTSFFSNISYGNHCEHCEKNQARSMRSNLPEQKAFVVDLQASLDLKFVRPL